MRVNPLAFVGFAVMCGILGGCAQVQEARSVYKDGTYGVIALERDNKNSRRQAEKMMAQHFPGGYEIVREEEIVTGTRKSDQVSKKASEIKPGAGMSHLFVGVGESSVSSETNNQEEIKIHEVRIIYRNRKDKPVAGFTALASATPEMYKDPTIEDHKKDDPKSEKGKVVIAGAKAKDDPVVKKASTDD
jgi:hypothetical protein